MTFRVKLTDWIKANPGLTPTHPVWVETTFGNRKMVVGDFLEFIDEQLLNNFTKQVMIKSKVLYKIKGPIDTAEIELPISYLMEKETIRDKKIYDICQ